MKSLRTSYSYFRKADPFFDARFVLLPLNVMDEFFSLDRQEVPQAGQSTHTHSRFGGQRCLTGLGISSPYAICRTFVFALIVAVVELQDAKEARKTGPSEKRSRRATTVSLGEADFWSQA